MVLSKRGRYILAISILGLLQACAASSKTPDATTPATPPTEPAQASPHNEATTTVVAATPEQANDEFNQAEQHLAEILGNRAAKKETQLSQGATSEDKPNDACNNACRAFASMERAASRLCELTENNDPRCTSANERINNARERIKTTCTTCTG